MRRMQAASDDVSIPLVLRATESLEQIRPLSRLFVRDGNRIVPMALASLEWAQGADVRNSEIESKIPFGEWVDPYRRVNSRQPDSVSGTITSIERC
jgi:hypothetical protein